MKHKIRLLSIDSCPLSLTPVIAALAALASTLAAQSGDIGFEGPDFPVNTLTPTESKPESKLWYNDGDWWGILWSDAASAYTIHRHQHVTEFVPPPDPIPRWWTDTGRVIDSRTNSHCDVLWYAPTSKLYIATHEFQVNGSTTGHPINLCRFTYNGVAGTYNQDAGFPVAIGDVSTEALTIDMDSTGRLWATWTQSQTIRINFTTGTPLNDATWNTMGTTNPLTLPNASSLAADDICALIAFNDNTTGAVGPKIGVFWSDQTAGQSNAVYRFSFHLDTSAATAGWSNPPQLVTTTPGDADDHINLKTDNGRLFVAGKTNGNDIVLLERPNGGPGWTKNVAWQTGQAFTRPIVLLNLQTQMMHVFATKQNMPDGQVFEKVSSMTNISFPSGDGTMVLRDASQVFRISNPTSTKQSLNNTTGLVILAHHDSTGLYWHNDL